MIRGRTHTYYTAVRQLWQCGCRRAGWPSLWPTSLASVDAAVAVIVLVRPHVARSHFTLRSCHPQVRPCSLLGAGRVFSGCQHQLSPLRRPSPLLPP